MSTYKFEKHKDGNNINFLIFLGSKPVGIITNKYSYGENSGNDYSDWRIFAINGRQLSSDLKGHADFNAFMNIERVMDLVKKCSPSLFEEKTEDEYIYFVTLKTQIGSKYYFSTDASSGGYPSITQSFRGVDVYPFEKAKVIYNKLASGNFEYIRLNYDFEEIIEVSLECYKEGFSVLESHNFK